MNTTKLVSSIALTALFIATGLIGISILDRHTTKSHIETIGEFTLDAMNKSYSDGILVGYNLNKCGASEKEMEAFRDLCRRGEAKAATSWILERFGTNTPGDHK